MSKAEEDAVKAKIVAKVEELSDNILAIMDASGLQPHNAVIALVNALSSAVGSIGRKDLRQLTRENIERMIPDALDFAMGQPFLN